MSQTQLAVAVGLKHQQQVSTWEARDVIPSDRYRMKLAQVLGVDINEWIAEEYQRRYEQTADELATTKTDNERLAVMLVEAIDDFRSLADEVRTLISRFQQPDE